jgi:AraC family transcriptional regulator of adaptative response / DNA-3-methyladenine glycosylase II
MSTPQPLPEHKIWDRARLARDARFDGRFYIGVRTTGIYCRPICPANSPKRENIQYFPTAAAAGEAGYRPCLRCRPECAPGTPAWSGTSTTVRRGLRLIAGGALDDGDIEQLADRLGVTSRHLRRLFTKHLGASPLAVAHTQRLHFAKRLVDDTRLPMSHVASAAGYGSVRRFNDAFRKTWGRTPRALRKDRDDSPPSDRAATLTLRMPCRLPYDWPAMLEFLAARATPGVEEVSGTQYRRTLAFGDEHGVIEVLPAREPGFLALSVRSVATRNLFDVMQRGREAFDLDAPVGDITAALRRDPVLRKLIRNNAGVRVPGSWDGFELTVRAILGQQISVKAATTMAGRIAQAYGAPLRLAAGAADSQLTRVFPTAAELERAPFTDIGLVRSRAETIRRLAAAVVQGDVTFDPTQDPQEFCKALCSIKGIGDWTAQYVAMRVLKYPDAFPASDLGLLKALERPSRLTPAELQSRAEAWRPWRAYAAQLLWGSLKDSGG